MKIFSFDAETNGLWGQAFQIAAIVTVNGEEIARFSARCPIVGEVNPWVAENVIPAISHIPQTHSSYEDMLAAFSNFYLSRKYDAHVIVHMGYIVESTILRDMYSRGLIGEWDAPYPLIDISGNLQQAGHDPLSVDDYAIKMELDLPKGSKHDAIYDCIVAEKVYRHLMQA